MRRHANTTKSWMNAITFAEAGEWDTAREMVPESANNREISWLQKIFMAVSFAEAGMPEEALRITENPQISNRFSDDFMATIGLRGIRMTYGVLAIESGQ
ncbi:MAG: hypothetical protein KKB30_08230 [Proteobacteria bacterium]|nr:hypothetical protein [Pseudomonadota bacterium]MBU1714807.1 hypothetical protein [Pseudomonadota bacterium]